MKAPKKILQVCGSASFAGGMRAFIMNLYRNIDKSKIQFDFLRCTSNPGDDYYDDEIISTGGKIYKVPSIRPSYSKYRNEIYKFFRNNTQYDVVHNHFGGEYIYFDILIAAKKFGAKKIIYHGHSSSSTHYMINKALRFFYQSKIKKYATDYFACSDVVAQHLYGKYTSIIKPKIINNAINIEKFLFNNQVREKMRTELNIENKCVIGHVGRLSSVKNHNFILEIFKIIYEKNRNFVLLLVGEGELRDDIERKADLLGLKNNIIFTGMRPDVNELLQAMDLFLLPSLYEGLPIVLVEAQASGLKCIISDVITKQVNITDLIKYISLEKPAVYWAEQILLSVNGYERKNMQKELRMAGFDINELCKYFERFYLE